MSRRTLSILTVLPLMLFTIGCEGDAGPAGPAGPSSILGFATIDGASTPPVVLAFGGFATTNVTVNRVAAGIFDVTFTGDFSGAASVDDLVVLATISDTNDYHVASASMDFGSVNATTFSTRIFVWSTVDEALEDEDFSVVVLQ